MSKFTAVLEGYEQLDAELERLLGALTKALEPALQAGGKIIVGLWKDRVKRDAYRTGNYLRSIHTWVDVTEELSVEVVVGTDITDPPYPFFLEYGTVNLAPRPTATPAFQEGREPALREIEAVLRIVVVAMYGEAA